MELDSPVLDVGLNDGQTIPTDEFDLDNDDETNELTDDLDIGARVHGSEVDMGAYERCPFDIAGGEGSVGVADLLLLLSEWDTEGPCPECISDFNDDDLVTVPDLLLLLDNWGDCANPSAPGAAPPPQYVDDCMERYTDPEEQAACIEAMMLKEQGEE